MKRKSPNNKVIKEFNFLPNDITSKYFLKNWNDINEVKIICENLEKLEFFSQENLFFLPELQTLTWPKIS